MNEMTIMRGYDEVMMHTHFRAHLKGTMHLLGTRTNEDLKNWMPAVSFQAYIIYKYPTHEKSCTIDQLRNML